VVKVKVGPITAQYKGTAVFVEKDPAQGRVVLRCTGRDTRGQGNANATITATMEPDGDGTRVTVTTDLTVTGKVAQFGRGVLAEVSAKLIGQFVDALEADLRDNGATPAPPGEDAAPEAFEGSSSNGSAPGQPAAVTAGVVSSAAGTSAPGAPAAGTDVPTIEIPASAPAAPPGPRKVNQPDPEPADLFEAAGGSLLKRLAPLAAGLGLVFILAVWRRRRRQAKRAG
jgi:carbon monoxide dehydrogenase subunit G